jgi:hypothetical protein
METTAPPSSGFFDKDTGAEAEKKFPQSPMRLDPEKRFAKHNKAGNVQNRVWRELVKLHAINKEKPTKKFVGRKRKSAQEKARNITR